MVQAVSIFSVRKSCQPSKKVQYCTTGTRQKIQDTNEKEYIALKQSLYHLHILISIVGLCSIGRPRGSSL